MFSGKILWLLVILLTVGIAPARATDLMGDPSDSWEPGPRESKFASLDEERFQMECDYLGIGGERKDEARKLFEKLIAGRDRVISSRDSGRISRPVAIEKLDNLDLEYYTGLKGQVKGRRNQERLEKMIRKAGARGTDDSAALNRRAVGSAGQ